MTRFETVELDKQSQAIVDQQVGEGNFGSPSEAIRAGLQLLEERQAQIERLRAAIIEGEESGPSEPFDFDEFLAEARRNFAKR